MEGGNNGFVAKAQPTDVELAAIVAAVEVLWPRPVVQDETKPRRQTHWQTSSRWWSPPVAARRHRPRPGRWG